MINLWGQRGCGRRWVECKQETAVFLPVSKSASKPLGYAVSHPSWNLASTASCYPLCCMLHTLTQCTHSNPRTHACHVSPDDYHYPSKYMWPEKPGTLSSHLSLAVIFFSPPNLFHALPPAHYFALTLHDDRLFARKREEEWRKNRNGRGGECSRPAGPLCSGVGLALRGNIMGIFSLFYIHRHNLLNTRNPKFPYHKLFSCSASFLYFSPSWLGVSFFISGFLWGLLHRWVPELQHLSLISCQQRWSQHTRSIGVKIDISTHLAANGETHQNTRTFTLSRPAPLQC